jgi:Cu(I)/Ag(I) efflux system membrane fusion protein
MIQPIIATVKSFAIIPNIHPILVHFTLALVSISFLMHVLEYVVKRLNPKNALGVEFGIVARWCLWLSMGFVILTGLAGLNAYYTVPHDEAGHAAMQTHKTAAIVSFTLILLVGIISIWRFKHKEKPSMVFIVLLFITQLSVIATGYLGAEVVYRYGIGVIKAQTPDMMTGHEHHHHDDEKEATSGHKDDDMAGMKMDGMDMSHEHESKDEDDNKDNANKVPSYWIDPMEPTVHYNKPGKSAMGMELVPVYPKPANISQLKNTITLPQAYIDNLGVATTPVTSSNLDNPIITYSYVEPAETNIAFITVYANGWVRNLPVRSVGATIKKGQLLAQIYSPTIINAEEEYLMALQSDNKILAAAAIKKLGSFHVANTQIQQLQKTHTVSQLINIYAPQNGIVNELNVREGDYVAPGTKLFNIVDLSSVWLIAAVFEKQTQWLKVGNAAIAKFAAYPDKSWQGTVEYIYPQLDAQTRSLKARLRFDNPGLLLKPNMYGNIIIATSPKLGSLSIPSQSVIHDTNGNRVIVALGKGVFQVRKITTGEETGGRIEILSGLSLGESVVKSGEFMLDSEANLSAASDRMDDSTASTAGN